MALSLSSEMIQNILDHFAAVKVLVVGDIMLDQYWFGETQRISPEAPVPITKIENTEIRAGGAANVARNISSLGANASLLSITGEDHPASQLEKLLQESHVIPHFIRDKTLTTTIKLRVIARQQQLLRIDFEDEPSEEATRRLKKAYIDLIQQHDAVIFSDYDKGGLKHVSKLLQIAKHEGRLVLIDPKGDDYKKYQGADMITPNRSELKAVIGNWQNEKELTKKAMALREKLHIKSLLLTRSEEGLSLYQRHWSGHDATVPQEVFDVSGAGDTIIAAATLALAIGLSNQLLMRIANAAAGVVVSKLGTATCSKAELMQKLLSIEKVDQ